MSNDEELLVIDDMHTWFRTPAGMLRAVDGVSLSVHAGETLGIVGESGSGKSVLMRSVMRLLPSTAFHPRGRVVFDGDDLGLVSAKDLRQLWGPELAMVFQDPMTSLNPVVRVGRQVSEAITAHQPLKRDEARRRSLALLELVGIPEPARRLRAYPHELSGGMRQRVGIAIALACQPRLLIADEPTTALDVTIQSQILDLITGLQRSRSMAMVLITHNLGIVAGRTDRVAVMYAGRLVELAPTVALFSQPRHPYTAALLASIPRMDAAVHSPIPVISGRPPAVIDPPPGCRFAPRCPLAQPRCIEEYPFVDFSQGPAAACHFPIGTPAGQDALEANVRAGHTATGLALSTAGVELMAGSGTAHLRSTEDTLLRVEHLVVDYRLRSGERVHAVSDVSFDVKRGETLGLVGESGCGKSTTGRSVMMLPPPTSGSVRFQGSELTALRGEELRQLRPALQMIFQDPISSLNPRRKVRDIVGEGAAIWHKGGLSDQVDEVLTAVGLDPGVVRDRRPYEFSGGQCQRIAIARALLLQPEMLICDEPVSALDVSVQAQIINLLEAMKARYGLTMLFIAHDLAVVKRISDVVAVMYLGKLCEVLPSDLLDRRPRHPYTAALLEAIPQPDPLAPLRPPPIQGEIPSPIAPPSGCRFRTRCPRAQQRCADEEPSLRSDEPGHYFACHFPLDATQPMSGSAHGAAGPAHQEDTAT